MSDARPITNVTDFVCSSCWTSFSRHDPGVDRGDHVVCPHCGHKQTIASSKGIVDAVLAAPPRHSISDGFDSAGPQTLPAFAIPEVDSSPVAPSSHGWLPPDLVARSAEPAGFVVGEPDDMDDFEFSEQTLRPDLSHEGLLQAVRTTQTPVAVIDEDQEIDVNEPTPPEGAPPLEALTPEQRDWKLKAIGLTYNFHGLDALLGWASNKAGQPMQVSQDGTTWRDFAVFLALYRAGVPADKAFADAANPDALAALTAAPVNPSRPASRAMAPELLPTGRPESGAFAPRDSAPSRTASGQSAAVGSGSSAASSSAAAKSSGSMKAGSAPKASGPIKSAAATSAKRPAAAAQEPATNSRTVQIAIAVVVVLAVVGVLVWQGVLPGLK